MPKVTVWNMCDYDLVGTDDCYITCFREIPEIKSNSCRVAGQIFNPEDIIISMKSTNRKSALYSSYVGPGIQYVGTYYCDESKCEFLMFVDAATGKPNSFQSNGWGYMYFSFINCEDHLMYCSSSGSPRIIQPDILEKFMEKTI